MTKENRCRAKDPANCKYPEHKKSSSSSATDVASAVKESLEKAKTVSAKKVLAPKFFLVNTIDNPELKTAIANSPIFQKQGKVTVEIAKEETVLQTVLADGRIETTNTVPAGDAIVTNPDGERYAMSVEKMNSRYEPTDEAGVYSAKGRINAVKNPYGKDVEIVASWGESQFGDKNCWFAVPVESDETPYIIDSGAFANTYAEEETAKQKKSREWYENAMRSEAAFKSRNPRNHRSFWG